MTSASNPFMSYSDNTFRKPQGTLFATFIDSITRQSVGRMQSLGSVSAELDTKPEYIDLRDNQTPRRDRIGRRCVMIDSSIKIGLMQYVGIGLQMMLMSSGGASLTQVANATLTQDEAAVKALNAVVLHDANGTRVFEVQNLAVYDGHDATGRQMVAGKEYKVDLVTGVVQFAVSPTSGAAHFAFAAPVIAATDGHAVFNYLKTPEQLGRIEIRETNMLGIELSHVWPLVMFSPPSSIKLIGNGNEVQTTEIEAIVLSDSDYPGQETGWATVLG